MSDDHLYRVIDAIDEVAKETGKSVSHELAAATTDGRDADHRRAHRGAVSREPRRHRMVVDQGAGRETGRREQSHAAFLTGTNAGLSATAIRRRYNAFGEDDATLVVKCPGFCYWVGCLRSIGA
jgi:hypothetical protein